MVDSVLVRALVPLLPRGSQEQAQLLWLLHEAGKPMCVVDLFPLAQYRSQASLSRALQRMKKLRLVDYGTDGWFLDNVGKIVLRRAKEDRHDLIRVNNWIQHAILAELSDGDRLADLRDKCWMVKPRALAENLYALRRMGLIECRNRRWYRR